MTMRLLLIHGMYMNGESWTPWLHRAAGAGFTAEAPSWPFHAGAPAALRADADDRLGRLTFGAILEHYKKLIDALPERPYLIGHSVGGLLVQKLLNDGYAAAAVAISPAPPRGIIAAGPHFLRANFPHVNPLAGNRPVRMTPPRFHYAFCNTMSRAASDAAFDAYAVPESRNVPRSLLVGRAAAIDFSRPHAPLHILSGDADHLTPIGAVRRNARAYRRSPAPVELDVFAGRCHFICGQDGWEAVADRAFEFLSHAGA